MTKNRSNKKEYPMTEKHEHPKMSVGKHGELVFECPFCTPTHIITPGRFSNCGTRLEIRATQMIFKAKYDHRLICVKCKKGGGEMAQWQDGFIHTHDCMPGVFTLEGIPPYSKLATFVYSRPIWMKKRLEKIFGEAIKVDEVLPDGTRTGKVLGHFFYKEVKNVEHPTTVTN